MSDPHRRSTSLTGRGGPPSTHQRVAEEPPEYDVGAIEWRDEAPRALRVELSPEQLGQLTLQLQGALGGPPKEPRPPFGELVADWLESIREKRVRPGNEVRLSRYLRPLFLDDEDSLRLDAVEKLLAELVAGGLAASTVNKIRGCGRLAVEHAMARRRWSAPNPFALVRRLKEPQRQYELLTLDELAAVQAQLRPDRRRMFRVALHLGLRTGELLALRKEDVDFDRGVVHVRRSHARDETKTGRTRVVPIHPAVAGDLFEALELARKAAGDTIARPELLVFGSDTGELQRADTKLTRVLRTAMAAAHVGLLEVVYKCRRPACRAVKVGAPPVMDTDCDECEFRMWAVASVRPVRWYDLRHICATLHHRAGADPLCIALALGHSVRGTTQAVYTHPDDATMMRELTKWRLD